MIRILPLGRTCKDYLRLYEKSRPKIYMCCPHCKRNMHKHDHYYRTAAMKRRVFKIPIYRWICPLCKRTLSLLPDFLIPWARYTTIIREAAVQRKIKGQSFSRVARSIAFGEVAVSRCTVKRWWKRHLEQVAKASLWIAKQLVHAGTEQDLLRQYNSGVDFALEDTIHWFKKLLSLYAPERTPFRGYWQWLNTKLPADYLL